MKILAFGASSSKASINKQLATYTANLIADADIRILDLNDYEMPIFSEDKEKELGQPELAASFLSEVTNSDAVIISFAEHNGSYSAAYKNIFDWCSRINTQVYQNKPMVLLSASPGESGAANVLALAVNSMPLFEGDVKASVSVPNFYDNFNPESKTIIDENINSQLITAANSLLQ